MSAIPNPGGAHLDSLAGVSGATSLPDVPRNADARVIGLLSSASVGLAGASDYRAALSALARVALPELARWCVVHGREGDGPVRLLASAHADSQLGRRLRDLARRCTPSIGEGAGVARAMSDRLPLLVAHADPAEIAAMLGCDAANAELASEWAALGAGSALVVPLAMGERFTLCASWGREQAAPPFDDADLALVTTLIEHVGPTLAFAHHAHREAVARAEAEAARQHVTSALEGLPDGFLSLDQSWRITYLNPAASRLWGLPRASSVGRVLWDLVPTPQDAPLRLEATRAMRDGVSAEAEAAADSGRAWLSVRAVPTPVGVSLYLRDVTDRRAADSEREQLLVEAGAARAAAEQANQSKTDFLATMSHELRTPLNAILGYVALIADGISGPVAEAQALHLGRVRASANHLLALIEEVLSFARLEAGTETVRLEPADAVTLARDAAHLVEPVIEAHGLSFVVEAPDALPLSTDARKLRQILLNLLANAARFTPAGGEVRLRVARSGAVARFTVRDTGIGIAPSHQERIFEPFWQVEQKLTRRAGGTGLGLSVSRRLARLLGGDVTVSSEPGAGSAFMVVLPLHPAARSAVERTG